MPEPTDGLQGQNQPSAISTRRSAARLLLSGPVRKASPGGHTGEREVKVSASPLFVHLNALETLKLLLNETQEFCPCLIMQV